MRLDKWIQKHCKCGKSTARKMIARGSVIVDSNVVIDSLYEVDQFQRVLLDGELVQDQEAYYIMLNKPAGVVSATVDSEHKTVVSLIDEHFADTLHLAGRLDKESTGLVILTNDGIWSRKLTEPDEVIPKSYLVTTEHEILPETVNAFTEGFYFAYEDITTLPAELEIHSEKSARVVLYEGKYHQIKRMFHAVGNRITSLHRERMGEIMLDKSLPSGSYRSLSSNEINSVI